MHNNFFSSFSWHYTDWSECSATCGGGVKRRTVQCLKIRGGVADEEFCNTKPPSSVKPCAKQPCRYSWNSSDWSEVCLSNTRTLFKLATVLFLM